ncbi:MAG TPA: 4-hydroxyphenyl-beta-ketoacyl-CoA hydrolase, partial [Micrococcaceae bacterium]|nr:4-hydroxyphenyl-beta-ketoacyl-CoA hydrolase [Micrococcaceae bacterium]
KLRYSNPLLLDDVAADFPHLTIIMAHPSVPWQDEANSIATHKANVYIDLSGWSPKYFPASLVKMGNNVLAGKLLFGTDYPLITPQKWMGAFGELELKDSVRPGILKGNAMRVLGVDG